MSQGAIQPEWCKEVKGVEQGDILGQPLLQNKWNRSSNLYKNHCKDNRFFLSNSKSASFLSSTCRCLLFYLPVQTPKAVSTRGGSFTATATDTSAADTLGRTQRRTAEITAATWPASTVQRSRTLSEVGERHKILTHRAARDSFYLIQGASC